jgi:hypothetical protein
MKFHTPAQKETACKQQLNSSSAEKHFTMLKPAPL